MRNTLALAMSWSNVSTEHQAPSYLLYFQTTHRLCFYRALSPFGASSALKVHFLLGHNASARSRRDAAAVVALREVQRAQRWERGYDQVPGGPLRSRQRHAVIPTYLVV